MVLGKWDASLQQLEPILAPSSDDQQIITAEELLQNQHLQQKLYSMGGLYRQDSLMLKIIGLNHQAFDKPGLTRIERERRRAVYERVLKVGLHITMETRGCSASSSINSST